MRFSIGRAQWRQAAALLLVAAGVVLCFRLQFESFHSFMTKLDPGRDACADKNHQMRLACDFANHYYREGAQFRWAPVAVFGFVYSAFFALCLELIALLPYATAVWVWQSVVVVAVLVLLLTPLCAGWLRSAVGRGVYAVALVSALPVLHDFAYGQVSSILTALILGSFLAYRVRRVRLSALVLAGAASIKFYPALFAVHYAFRRDWRGLATFAIGVFALTLALPLGLLGADDYLAFHSSLAHNLTRLSEFVRTSAYSNFVANVLTHATLGRVETNSAPYVIGLAVGACVAAFNLGCAYRACRMTPLRTFAPYALGFVTLPLVVPSCWMHYFVFLPVLQAYVAHDVGAVQGRWLRLLCWAGVGLSALLISFVPFALLPDPDAFYRAGVPFWATCALLPGLYAGEFRRSAVADSNAPRGALA